MNLEEYYKEWGAEKVEKLMTELEVKEFTNPKMKEMKASLDLFKQELSEVLLDNTSLSYGSFKKNFYPNLEKLLCEIIISINSKDGYEEKINKAYTWYQKRLEVFNKLKNIDRHSVKDKYQVLVEELNPIVKSHLYAADNYPRVEFEHEYRTDPLCSLKQK